MRLPLLFATLAAYAFADPSAIDIVKKSLDRDERNSKQAKDYTYQERQETREVDGQGKVKSTHSKTYDVLSLYGRPYRKLVSKDGKPLSPSEEAKQETQWKKAVEQRRRQSEDVNSKEFREYEKRRQEQRRFIREIPDAYDFELIGEETVSGKPAWVIMARPKPGFKPRDSRAAILTKMRGTLWIDKAEYQWVKVAAENADTISLGGFLLRLGRGSTMNFEQSRVNDEVWLPSHARIAVGVRVALLKNVHIELESTYKDYKKFQTDSRVVSTEAEARP